MHDEDVASYLSLAQQTAWRIAWLPEHVDDLVQEGLVALLIAARKTKQIDNPGAFAHTVFRRAMQDFYSIHDRKDRMVQPAEDAAVHVAVINIEPLRKVLWQEELHRIDAYFDAVREALGSRAERIARNLHNPDEGVRWLAERDARRRQAQVAAGGFARHPGRAVVKKAHIRQHLHIREDEWPQQLANLRAFTSDFFQTDGGAREQQPS